jgi:hypothetical protein
MELAPVYDLSAVNQRQFRNFQFLVQRDNSATLARRLVVPIAAYVSARALKESALTTVKGEAQIILAHVELPHLTDAFGRSFQR